MPTSSQAMPIRHYLQFTDLTADEYAHIFQRAASIKAKFKAYEKYQPLTDRTMAMIFEKAWAKLHLSYEATAGGNTGDAFSYLSGGIIASVPIPPGDANGSAWDKCYQVLSSSNLNPNSYTLNQVLLSSNLNLNS